MCTITEFNPKLIKKSMMCQWPHPFQGSLVITGCRLPYHRCHMTGHYLYWYIYMQLELSLQGTVPMLSFFLLPLRGLPWYTRYSCLPYDSLCHCCCKPITHSNRSCDPTVL